MAMRHLGLEALAARRPASERRHVGLGPGLIDEDEAGRIDLRLMALPPSATSCDVRAILLAGDNVFPASGVSASRLGNQGPVASVMCPVHVFEAAGPGRKHRPSSTRRSI
jgi:hypothetical protein